MPFTIPNANNDSKVQILCAKTRRLRAVYWSLHNAYSRKQGLTPTEVPGLKLTEIDPAGVTGEMVDDAHRAYVRAFNQARKRGKIR